MGRIRTQDVDIQRKRLAREQGTIRKDWGGRVPLAANRTENDPIVIAGGPSVSGNPEPVAPMLDAVIVGEVEPVMAGLQEVFNAGGSRWDQIDRLARLPGVYVPANYTISYASNGTISHLEPAHSDVALPVARLNARNVNEFHTMSAVLSPDIELGDMFLVEMTRGCARGCRFCLAGYTSLPVRHRHVDHLIEAVKHGLQFRKRVGLISAATSDHPELEQLLDRMMQVGADISLSS